MRHAPPRVEPEQPRPTAPKARKPRAATRAYAPEVACDLPDDIPVSTAELGLVLTYLSDQIACILAGDDNAT